MKKLLLVFTLLFLVGCGKNFNQDFYAKNLLENRGFAIVQHQENLKCLRKFSGVLRYTDFLIIPKSEFEDGDIDKTFNANLKKYSGIGNQIIAHEKNYVELLNPFGLKTFIYKDKDSIIIVSGNGDDYPLITADLIK